MSLDYLLFQQVNQFAGKNIYIDSLAVFLADRLTYVLIAALLLFFLKDCKKYLIMVCQALFAAVLSRFVITEVIRFLYEKPRPFVEDKANLLLSQEATGSFPSGHAAFFFALSAVVYYHNKKAGILFFAASFLMGVSRVFSGVHWPSDILGGAVVGILTGWFVIALFRKFFSAGWKAKQQRA